MARNTRPGQFSPVSLKASEMIGKLKDPRLMLTYWAVARHTSMNDEGGLGLGPNRVSGASGGKVAAVLSCRHAMAMARLEDLARHGIIRNAPVGLPAGRMKQALWIMEYEGDVSLPHALIDGVAGSTGLKERILDKASSPEVAMCALLLLLRCYANHDLEKWGGINPVLLWRKWEMTARKSNQSFRLDGEPSPTSSTWSFITLVLAAMGLKVTNGNREELSQKIFWPAFHLLNNSGLIYEAVTLMNGDQAVVTIRLNDFHASRNELALIKDLLDSGFYTNKENDREEPEGCWFFWPEDPAKLSLKGVYRPRFRCATPETAKGLERDEGTIDYARRLLISQGTLEAA
jgi:hypothetical protein